MNEVQVFDEAEQFAVWTGDIYGFVYDDGEVWANEISLQQWRDKRAEGREVKQSC